MANILDGGDLKSVQDLRKEVLNLKNDLVSLKTSVENLQTSFNKQSKSQSDVTDKTKIYNNVEQEKLKLEEKINQSTLVSVKRNEELKIKLQEQNKLNKTLAKEKLGLISAYEKESRKLNDLRKRYKDLAVAGKENTREAKNLRKEITSLDKNLKKIDSSVGQHNRNVGNYGQAMQSLPGPIGSVINSMKMLAKVIFTTPLGWLIGLIAAAGATLKTFFAGSVEGQERWNKTMEKGKAVMSVFKDELISVGKRLSDFISSVNESDEGLKGWFNNIGEGLKTKWKNFKKDVSDKGVWTTLKDNAKDAYDSINEKLIETQKRLAENLVRAEIIANKENKLRKEEIKSLTETAQLRADIAELRAKAADRENTTAAQRIALIDGAIEKENEILAIEERLAKQRITIQKLQMEQGENTLEDYEKLAELEKNLIDLEARNSERRRRFQSERQTAIRQFASDVDRVYKDLAAENKSFQEEITNELIEAEENLTEKIKEEENKRLEAYKERLENQKQLDELQKQFEVEAGQAAIGIIKDQYNGFIDDKLAKYMASNEAEQEILKNRLDNDEISEEQYKRKIQALDLKARQESAKADKKKALFDIGIQTLVNIAKVAANPAQIPLVIAIGAVQAALVAAKPIPKFRHGSKGDLKDDTYAIVGDGGKQETIIDPYGNHMLTPDTPTGVFLQKGSRVLSGEETERLKEKSSDYAELIKETKLTRQAIMNQHKSGVEFTPSGVIYTMEHQNKINKVKKRYIN